MQRGAAAAAAYFAGIPRVRWISRVFSKVPALSLSLQLEAHMREHERVIHPIPQRARARGPVFLEPTIAI